MEVTRKTYFQRFDSLILHDLNREMTDRLKSAKGPYDPVYRTLKTHITISSTKCTAEPPLVSEVLKSVRDEIDSARGSDWQRLSDQQIEFYSNELVHGNPVPASEDSVAEQYSREYLRRIGGVDRIYNNILSNARKALPKPKSLAELAPNYAQVLRGPSEPPSGFVTAGWDFVVKASKDQKSALIGDCVFGDVPEVVGEIEASAKKEADLAPDIQRLYVRDYIRNWREFLDGYSVVPYNGTEDAIRKLDILSSNRSPLLALLLLTANQTNFPSEGLQKSVQGILQRVEKAAGIVKADTKFVPEVSGTPAEITQFFQPVHWVVPPNSDPWVSERTAAYMDALGRLRAAMQAIANSTDAAARVSAGQAAGQLKQSALDTVTQLARGFKANGLDQDIQRLLRQPIDHLFIPIPDPGGDVNSKWTKLCSAFGNTFERYPFRRSSTQDATLAELSAWFAPETGHVWKFQAEALGPLTEIQNSQWKAKDPSQKPQVTSDMLGFLNRAQSIKIAFYPKGATQPQIIYSLRPKLDSSFKASTVEMELDGQLHQWTSVFQKQFSWPAATGAKPGAIARIRTDNVAYPFTSHSGVWGVFRMMADAEPRAPLAQGVEWKYARTGEQKEEIQPAPVRMEFPEFPNGVDVFQSQFFDGMKCPALAVR